jgi:hypothetical protein
MKQSRSPSIRNRYTLPVLVGLSTFCDNGTLEELFGPCETGVHLFTRRLSNSLKRRATSTI